MVIIAPPLCSACAMAPIIMDDLDLKQYQDPAVRIVSATDLGASSESVKGVRH